MLDVTSKKYPVQSFMGASMRSSILLSCVFKICSDETSIPGDVVAVILTAKNFFLVLR